MANEKFKPDVGVGDNDIIVEYPCKSAFYPTESLQRLFGCELLNLLIIEKELSLWRIDHIDDGVDANWIEWWDWLWGVGLLGIGCLGVRGLGVRCWVLGVSLWGVSGFISLLFTLYTFLLTLYTFILYTFLFTLYTFFLTLYTFFPTLFFFCLDLLCLDILIRWLFSNWGFNFYDGILWMLVVGCWLLGVCCWLNRCVIALCNCLGCLYGF